MAAGFESGPTVHLLTGVAALAGSPLRAHPSRRSAGGGARGAALPGAAAAAFRPLPPGAPGVPSPRRAAGAASVRRAGGAGGGAAPR